MNFGPWCGPCKAFAPTFEEVSEELADVVFAKVKPEEQQALARDFGIRSIQLSSYFASNHSI